MTKPLNAQSRLIEEYWSNINDYRKKLKFREWEILNPYQEEERVGSGSGRISDTTGNRAMILVEDKNYQHLQNIINTIEKIYKGLDDDQKTIVDMRYWDKDGTYEWEDISEELGISRNKILRKRNLLVDKTAKCLGWL